MFLFEYFFLFSFSLVNSKRYYAFVETLFVIDRDYFPQPSMMSYEEYVRAMVDTTNIVFQSQNDLDVKIEMIVSDIVYLNIVVPKSQQPHGYESALRAAVADYERYDSIVLLWYQPWEGPAGAQGYALLKGVCDPKLKMMYVIPHQNAAFYLAHEFGHQLGLEHQSTTPCFSESYMSVMTESHTVSFEQARWTKCENAWINDHICQFSCLFNKPAGYQPIRNKFSTMPGERMKSDQQAKMAQRTPDERNEVAAHTYMRSDLETRCLYLRYLTGEANGRYGYIYSPMLPGSECGQGSICYLDRCVAKDKLDPKLFVSELVSDTLDLATHCASGAGVSALQESNGDTRNAIECIDWESEDLCKPSDSCPEAGRRDAKALYTNHICCAKCSSKQKDFAALFSRAGSISTASIYLSFSLLSLCLFFKH